MRDKNLPMDFWDKFAEHRALITNITAKYIFQLRGNTPHFLLLGKKVKFQTSVNLAGTNGFLSVKHQLTSL